MDNTESEKTDIPDWLLINENYIPLTDQDTFVNKSILSIFKVISRIKMQDSINQTFLNINVSLSVLCTAILLLLVSLTKSFVFVMIVNVYLLSILCVTDTDRLVRILKLSLGVTLFTAIIMLPAFLLGNSYSSIMITTKVFASITVVELLSHTTKWSLLTKALKRFYVPDIFILILDITIKYIYRLGERSLSMFHSLKLRSVGRNNKKYTSMAGVAGTMFLQSMEMAEEMYHAMECRGFSGEYHRMEKSKFKWKDYFYVTIHIGFLILYLYLGRMLP
jgi:cobalt/nickel transport system permease protein